MIPSSLLPRSRNKNGPTCEKNLRIFHIQSPLNIADQLNTWEKHAFAILIILCFHTRAPPSYMDLFRTKEMRVITILITILWMLIRSISTKRYFWNSQYFVFSLEFDCTVRNITNLDFSIYVSFCVSSWNQIMSNCEDLCLLLREFLKSNHIRLWRQRWFQAKNSDFSCSWVPRWSSLHCGSRVVGQEVFWYVDIYFQVARQEVKNFQLLNKKFFCSRWSAALSMLAVGLTILPCAWLTDQPMPQAVFAMAGRFFATYAMNTGFQFSVEVIWSKLIRVTIFSKVLPTTLRGQGMAVVHLMSMVSQVASPLIVYSVRCFINPSCHSTNFLFPEQAVREGTMDYHLADRPYCKHPR